MIRNARLSMSLGFLALGMVFVGCSGDETAQNFNTPEECFQFAQKAAADKDYNAAVACLTDDSQEVMAGMMVTAGSFAKTFGGMAAAFGEEGEEAKSMQDAVNRIGTVLEKHGITEKTLTEVGEQAGALVGGIDDGDAEDPEQALVGIRAMAKPVQDHQAFVAEMIEAMDALGNEGGDNPVQGFAGELKNVQINGDQATATIRKTDGNENPIGFRKTDRGWRIHLDANMLRTQPTSTTPTF